MWHGGDDRRDRPSRQPGLGRGVRSGRPLVEYARKHSQDPRASFVVAGAGSLPSRTGGYGSLTSLLALNFFPDPAAAVREMRSLAGNQGAVSACVWDYAGEMEFLRRFWDAAVTLDVTAHNFDEGRRFPVCHPTALTTLFAAGGLGDVRCEPISIATTFAGFDDYWRPLLGGVGPAPSYVASLDPGHRAMLARKLEETLPRGPGDVISLRARAWAVRGTAR